MAASEEATDGGNETLQGEERRFRVCGQHSSSRGFPQECTSSALRALSIIEVADFDLRGRSNLDAGAARRVHAVPQSRAELCADESLFELPCVPGPHGKTFLLSFKVYLQRCFYKPWPLDCPALAALVAKWAGLRRYLNLHPVEWSDPFASQACLGTHRDSCDER
jgi:hypothetical protein